MGKDRFGEGKDCSHLAADEQSLLSSMMRRTCAPWANGRKLLGVKKPPGHDMSQCSTSACPCTGTLPVCTAWAQGQAWAARDWPLLAVPACTWCGVKKHTKWKQGDQNQILRNGRPSNGPIPTGGTRALTIVQINIENVAKTAVRVQTLSQGHLGGWEN